MGGSILEWVSVFLVGLCLGLSVAILVILWRVWGSTDRTEQDGKERLAILRDQQQRLGQLREERRILLEELERLREQKERLQWLREGRAALLSELKKLRSQLEEQRRHLNTPLPAPTEQPRLAALGESHNESHNGHGRNEHDVFYEPHTERSRQGAPTLGISRIVRSILLKVTGSKS